MRVLQQGKSFNFTLRIIKPNQKTATFKMTTPTSIDTNNLVYFWRPEGEYGFLGQWWPSSFSWKDGDKEYTYANAEQYLPPSQSLVRGDKSSSVNP